jgi:hypothetical protein
MDSWTKHPLKLIAVSALFALLLIATPARGVTDMAAAVPGLQSVQLSDPSGTELMARIRSELSMDPTLSDLAKNVTLRNENGKIVVEGPVLNLYERTRILKVASEAAGSVRVDDRTDLVTMVAE